MPRNYRSLKALKIRPDWNKYTLYALSRLQSLKTKPLTYFQQKWRAKSALRAYHGPHLREGYWTRLFTRRLNGVVSMDYRYLAKHDGSELASGRGAGSVTEEDGVISEQNGQSGKLGLQKTPYMGMTFFPLERRLDTAIWRALFASSIAQARQMVVHGAVRVNGKKTKHAGYLLNPGDMFQIEPDRVMYSTGARKKKRDERHAWGDYRPHPLARGSNSQTSGEQRMEDDVDEAEVAESITEPSAVDTAEAAGPKPVDLAEAKQDMKAVRDMAKSLLNTSKEGLSGKRLRELRDFGKRLKVAMSKMGRKTEDEASLDVATFQKAFEEIAAAVPEELLPSDQAKKRKQDVMSEKMQAESAKENAQLLVDALAKARENPVDSTKPYATPWMPRQYMSAFAFIPRYLEVNQNICSAVYIRHPVARPGTAEVPTPFDPDSQQLAFNWYLRRR